MIVASLSLHYFGWAQTLEIVQRIRQTLRPSGVLLCRFNSTNDRNFGAVGHSVIDQNFYLVHGEPKRFFDRPSVLAAFADGWRFLSLEETASHRYVLRKVVWEAAIERVDTKDDATSVAS